MKSQFYLRDRKYSADQSFVWAGKKAAECVQLGPKLGKL